MAQIFSERAPEVVGDDYLVIGTFERDYWKQGLENPNPSEDLLANLHGFKQYLNFKLVGGWLPNETAPQPPAPPAKKPAPSTQKTLDNVKDASRLVSMMESGLPIPVRATKELLQTLRKQGLPLSDRQTLSIRRVFYGGDEMGIACDVTPSGQKKQAVVCSLTHLQILGDTPLAREMRAYQQRHRDKLARQPGYAPSSFTVRPKGKKW